MPILDVLRKTAQELEAGRDVALCAIVATRGSTPQPAGSIVCVDMGGRMTGTLGGGCGEAEVNRKAFELLCATAPATPSSAASDHDRETTALLHTLRFDHDFGYDDGMICGGEIDVAVRVLTPSKDGRGFQETLDRYRSGEPASITLRVPRNASAGSDAPTTGEHTCYRLHLEVTPRLLIAGAGHISRILAQIAVGQGFQTAVYDDRSAFANRRRFPPPMEPVVGDIAHELTKARIDPNTYIVIVTRGHKRDEQVLEAVLSKPARYIGMIGSRRKVKVLFDDLRHHGATEEQLARVHAPIGLEIGAVTTEEIALSIAAQLVSVRRKKQNRPIVEVVRDGPAGTP